MNSFCFPDPYAMQPLPASWVSRFAVRQVGGEGAMDRVTELQLQTHNLAKLMADSIGFIQQNAPASADFAPAGGAAVAAPAPTTVSKEQLTEFCASYGTDITKTTEAVLEVSCLQTLREVACREERVRVNE